MTVIPDSMVPKSAWRAWQWNGHRLVSRTHGMVWEPGVAARALCQNLGQGVPGATLMVNVLEQGRADAIRNHMAQNYSPPIYEVDEGENRVYFTKKSYFVIPRAIPVKLQVPAIHCQCGIYATNDLNEATSYGEILGRVAMWGHVIEHSGGYRAQFAYPQSLYVPDEALEGLKAALSGYGVPVLGMSELIQSRRLQSGGTLIPDGGGTSIRYQTLVLHHTAQDDEEDEEEDISPGDGVKNVTVWSWLRKKFGG